MKCPNCGKEIASDSVFCEYCGKKVTLNQKTQNERSLSFSSATSSTGAMTLEDVSKLSVTELNQELANGARFVRFSYTISIVVLTFKRYSKIFFIRKNDSISSVRLPYTLINLFLGWWGIPFGPIYTIWSLVENAKGKDVTEEVILAINNSNK